MTTEPKKKNLYLNPAATDRERQCVEEYHTMSADHIKRWNAAITYEERQEETARWAKEREDFARKWPDYDFSSI